jgi:hypothetical protein
MPIDRDEELENGDRPTLPYDLREYAVLHTGPESWTAERAAKALPESQRGPGITPVPADVLAELDEPLEGEPTLRSGDVPQVAISSDEIREHALDHREGYVLSLIDGVSNVEALCDITGLPKEETLRVLAELCDRGVLTMDDEPLPEPPWQIHVQRYAI